MGTVRPGRRVMCWQSGKVADQPALSAGRTRGRWLAGGPSRQVALGDGSLCCPRSTPGSEAGGTGIQGSSRPPVQWPGAGRAALPAQADSRIVRSRFSAWRARAAPQRKAKGLGDAPFLGGRTLPLIVMMGCNKPAQTPPAADMARHPDDIDVTVPVAAALLRRDWLTDLRDPFVRLRSRRPSGGSGVDVAGLPSGNETGRLHRRCARVVGAVGVHDHDQAGCRW
jgi:hypothetical protein